jgi:hypothetical protein
MTIGGRMLGVVAVASLLSPGATGRAEQGQGEKSGPAGAGAVSGEADLVATTGTIQSIDRDNHLLVFKDQSGDQIKVQVPPGLPGFDQVKKGQRVDLTYYDSIAVSFLPPGAAQPADEAPVQVEPSQQGGMVGRELTVAAEVVNVDSRNKTVKLKMPNGRIQKISVIDADLQKHLGDLKPGQLATVTYTEAVAASILPALQAGNQRAR